jgi:hypothetical protein
MNKIVHGAIIFWWYLLNTDASIRLSRESRSNKIDESDSQHEKHDFPRISISE